MTPARALIHDSGFVAWHTGVSDGESFAYHRFVKCHRVPRVLPVDHPDVLRVEAVSVDA